MERRFLRQGLRQRGCMKVNEGDTRHVTFDKSGSLNTAVWGGGSLHWGVVFKLAISNGHASGTVLYSFTGSTDGFNPHAGLVLDANGNLYGVTFQGGTGG